MFIRFLFSIFLIIFYSNTIISKENWILDKELSEISFEVPISLSKNIKGKLIEFNSSVFIDDTQIDNNRAICYVNINSIEMNYNGYREILLSNIFFDEKNFPIALIDTKKFTLPIDNNYFEIKAELQIKDIVHIIPFMVQVNYLSNNLVQVISDFKFSRTDYELGKKSWSSTLVLKDKIHLKTNLFFKKKS